MYSFYRENINRKILIAFRLICKMLFFRAWIYSFYRENINRKILITFRLICKMLFFRAWIYSFYRENINRKILIAFRLLCKMLVLLFYCGFMIKTRLWDTRFVTMIVVILCVKTGGKYGDFFFIQYNYISGHAETQFVESLRYKPEGRGFDPR